MHGRIYRSAAEASSDADEEGAKLLEDLKLHTDEFKLRMSIPWPGDAEGRWRSDDLPMNRQLV